MSEAPSPGTAGFVIRLARPEESELIASIVREAFQTVADSVGVDIPPLFESAQDVSAAFDAGDLVLVADVAGQLVGTVRGETMDSGSVMVRRLAVLPQFRGQGIARALMQALETAYPDAKRFELFTGADLRAPVRLYESLGYSHMEPHDTGGFPLVYLEKCR